MRKGSIILYITSLVCILLGVVGIILTYVFERMGYIKLAGVVSITGSIFEAIALILIIVRIVFFGFIPYSKARKSYKQSNVKTVNVKPVKNEKKQEETLYAQYEQLYKEGLITKEDLEKKKNELLN